MNGEDDLFDELVRQKLDQRSFSPGKDSWKKASAMFSGKTEPAVFRLFGGHLLISRRGLILLLALLFISFGTLFTIDHYRYSNKGSGGNDLPSLTGNNSSGRLAANDPDKNGTDNSNSSGGNSTSGSIDGNDRSAADAVLNSDGSSSSVNTNSSGTSSSSSGNTTDNSSFASTNGMNNSSGTSSVNSTANNTSRNSTSGNNSTASSNSASASNSNSYHSNNSTNSSVHHSSNSTASNNSSSNSSNSTSSDNSNSNQSTDPKTSSDANGNSYSSVHAADNGMQHLANTQPNIDTTMQRLDAAHPNIDTAMQHLAATDPALDTAMNHVVASDHSVDSSSQQQPPPPPASSNSSVNFFFAEAGISFLPGIPHTYSIFNGTAQGSSVNPVIGGGYEIHLGGAFSLQAGLRYTSVKNISDSTSEFDSTNYSFGSSQSLTAIQMKRLHYFSAPVNFYWHFGKANALNAGFMVNYLFTTESKRSITTYTSNIPQQGKSATIFGYGKDLGKYDLLFNAGYSYYWRSHMSAHVSAYYGLSTLKNARTNGIDLFDRNKGLLITLQYSF